MESKAILTFSKFEHAKVDGGDEFLEKSFIWRGVEFFFTGKADMLFSYI